MGFLRGILIFFAVIILLFIIIVVVVPVLFLGTIAVTTGSALIPIAVAMDSIRGKIINYPIDFGGSVSSTGATGSTGLNCATGAVEYINTCECIDNNQFYTNIGCISCPNNMKPNNSINYLDNNPINRCMCYDDTYHLNSNGYCIR